MTVTSKRYGMPILAALAGLLIRAADTVIGIGISVPFLIVITCALVYALYQGNVRNKTYTPKVQLIQNLAIGAIFGWSLGNFLAGYL